MKCVLWAALILFSLFLLSRYIERHNIYFPMKEVHAAPDIIGMPYEEIFFSTSDGIRLHGWFIPGEGASWTLLFCHGNAGNVSHRLEKLMFLRDLGLSIFIFDYRGYGKSEGEPGERGLYRDADAAYEYVTEKRRVSPDRVILYGESLGGAVAIDLAARRRVKAVITEETFTSIRAMARLVYPFMPPFMIRSKFDSLSKIAKVAYPKLIIHSVDDEIVPFSFAERLFDAAHPPKKLLKIRGSHNTAFFDSEDLFTKGIRSFLEDIS
jgi:fermentation-respiration switch protein FrsA (DUF1100 family)